MTTTNLHHHEDEEPAPSATTSASSSSANGVLRRRRHHTRINSVRFRQMSGEDDHEAETSAETSRIAPETSATDNNNNNNNNNTKKQQQPPPPHTGLVVVRYFLDRPGYGLHNSACRLWFGPPAVCTPAHVQDFLARHKIALPDLLTEVWLDQFESFMLLEACAASALEWDFQQTSHHAPGVLNVRLTDLAASATTIITTDKDNHPTAKSKNNDDKAASSHPPGGALYANPTPAGLLSFSMMVGLETASLLGKLVPGTVTPAFAVAHGPYMIFVGGLLQILVASFNVLRNNLYGATAFFGFGSFWFANGLTLVLKLHFSDDATLAGEVLHTSDPWGAFFRTLFVFLFSCALLKQTLVMSQLSTTLIGLLCLKVGAQAFTGWSGTMEWFQLVFGTITSAFAFYVFLVEFTNGVYHRDVFNPRKWSVEHSPVEVFGAAGRAGTLTSKATRLRQASFPNASSLRGAMADNLDKD